MDVKNKKNFIFTNEGKIKETKDKNETGIVFLLALKNILLRR